MRVLSALILAAALLSAASPASAFGDWRTRRVPLDPPPYYEDRPPPRLFFGGPARRARRTCVDVGAIARATVLDARTIELRMADGRLWRMRLSEDCPALGYYEGFYFRRSQPSSLCAGRDAVVARSGAVCGVGALFPIPGR